MEGQVSESEIRTKLYIKHKENRNKRRDKNTGQDVKKVEKDMDRDFFMSSDEAKKYGIIDKVLN